jgi:hypothetical protein
MMRTLSTKALGALILLYLPWLFVGLWGWSNDEPAVIVVAALALSMLPLVWWHRRASLLMRKEQQQDLDLAIERIKANTLRDYWQAEAMMNILSTLRPERPLPYTRGWAGAPDLLRHVLNIVLDQRPQIVLEASSGTSTIVIGHALKRLGSGKVISLEHDAGYAQQTNDTIRAHGLEEFAEVVHAPLIQHRSNGEEWKWYDLSKLVLSGPIELFVIDGPPQATQAMARYPAIPLLIENFARRTTVIMDDGDRPDERAIAARWALEYSAVSNEFLPFEAGAWLLTFERGR